MDRKKELEIRDRAMRLVRTVTLGAVFGAGTMTGVFSTAAAITFSGKPVAQVVVAPVVPVGPVPVQKAPAPAAFAGSVGAPAAGAAPQAAAPAAAPAPPAPVCVSTPSKPC